jgi:hypothetical protein
MPMLSFFYDCGHPIRNSNIHVRHIFCHPQQTPSFSCGCRLDSSHAV